MEKDTVVTLEDGRIATAMQEASKASRWLSAFMAEYSPPMDGERYLTDREVSAILKVSRRTMQVYRTNRILPYVVLGGKTLNPETKLYELLEQGYKKPVV